MAGLDQSNVSRIIAKIEPFLEQAADSELSKTLKKIENEKTLINTLNQQSFHKLYPDLERVVTDVTEVSIKRPGRSNEERKLYYSGKAKDFTLKVQVSVSKSQRFLHVTTVYPGSMHDKTIMDIEKTIGQFPEQSHQMLDLGYQGVVQEYPNHYVTLPAKKLKSCALSGLAKEHNKNIAKRRVCVENTLARPKKFAICAQVYRGRKCKFAMIFRNIAALCNLMLDA